MLSSNYVKDLQKLSKASDQAYIQQDHIPALPTDRLEWIAEARPYVGDIKRNFDWEPFIPPIIQDKHKSVIGLQARQTFKTTTSTDLLAHYATAHPHSSCMYIVDLEARLTEFSLHRLRNATFLDNPILAPFLSGGRASIKDVNLENRSSIHLRTDERGYKNVEGTTNHIMVFDESQYQELQFRSKALKTITQTKAQTFYFGIGGEAGSEWHEMWELSDQKEWVFDDPNWRSKLEFDEEGYLTNDNPGDIVSGQWIATKPENERYSGYHITQEMFARIPLTIDDAIHRYKTDIAVSIEFQRKHDPKSIVTAHVDALFYKAMRRPITPEMVKFCHDRTLSLLSLSEIAQLKQDNRTELSLWMGIDWGSGPSASSTVGVIMGYWKDTNRWQLLWLDIRPEEHEFDQAAHFVRAYTESQCDGCVADLGYGKDKVTLMQSGGYDSTGNKIEGLGVYNVMGSWLQGTPIEDAMKHKQETILEGPKKGTKKQHLSLDHTQIIQNFVDLVGTTVPDGEKNISQLILPMANDDCEVLMRDMCAVTRKDLDVDNQEIVIEDGREKPKKQFNHPRDTVISMVYAVAAKNSHSTDDFDVTPIVRRRRG